MSNPVSDLNDPDDAYAVGDDDIDWSNVDEVAVQVAEIDAIEDPLERKLAARLWAARVVGDI